MLRHLSGRARYLTGLVRDLSVDLSNVGYDYHDQLFSLHLRYGVPWSGYHVDDGGEGVDVDEMLVR